MKKVFLIAGLLIILVFIVFITTFGTSSSKKEHTQSTSSVVGNSVLVQRLQNLYDINLDRDLTLKDLEGMDEIVAGDHYAQDEFSELRFLIEKNEGAHASHIITAIQVYASTGQKTYCMPHEISHIRLYIKHNEQRLLEHALDGSLENLNDWQEYIKERQKENPSYFSNFDDINKRIQDVLKRVKSGERGSGLNSDLYYIEQYGIC